MTTLIKRFKNLSLRYKLLAIILFNVVIICICSILGYSIFSKVYNDLLYKTIAGNLSFSADTISEKLQNGETLSSAVLSDSIVQEHLTTLQTTDDVIQKENSNRLLNNVLTNYLNSYKSSGVAFIGLYNAQFSNCTNWASLHSIDSDVIESARRAAADVSGSAAFTIDTRNHYLLISRTVKKIENLSLTPIGDMLIALDMDTIVTNAAQANALYDGSQYILRDQENHLVYASESLSDDDIHFYSKKASDEYQLITYDGQSFFVLQGKLPHYEFAYINLVPFDSVRNTLHIALSLTFITLLTGMLFILFLSNYFIRYIVKQFDILIAKMKEFAGNEMTVLPDSTDIEKQKDELGSLHRQFSSMAKRIQALVNQNYVNELLKKDAQLMALKAQINPHFLYNTLESINFRAKASGNPEISQMAESLGSLLRSTLSDNGSLVTLQKEWELVSSYMTIQKIRYEKRLEYELSDISSIEQAVLPPLVVQPLAENAIRYGFEEMIDTCHIHISARRKDADLFIRVANEGSFFEDDLLEKLRTKEKRPSGFGIGLLNIEERIHLLFGPEYGLSFYNENGYAVAVIVLPYQTEVS